MQKTDMFRPLALIAVLAIIILALYIMMKPGTESTIGEHEPVVTPTVRAYENATYGIRFSYPDTYVVTEHDQGTGERSHRTIVLMDKIAAANIPQNGEGPTAIRIDVFGNGIDTLSVEQWVKNTSFSNYKLSPDEKLETATVSGKNGLTYTWDGLYRGESTVVSNTDTIFMFSVTYIDSTDPIRGDFAALLANVRLD